MLQLLSASEQRSGEQIARALGCSRSAVWKQVQGLREQGVSVVAMAGQGYRLAEPFELLDKARIERYIPPAQRVHLNSLEVVAAADSTNAELQRRAIGEQHAVALLAECQTAGRGRHGRSWFSPLARNIYLSLGWRFETGVAELSALPLLLALAASEALRETGLGGHVIKWPNDLLLEGRKLGGCLVELQGDASGPCNAVLGIGLNVRMPAGTDGADAIDQPWIDVASRVRDVSRNRLAASLLATLVKHLVRFERQGFGVFLESWAEQDGLAGHEIRLAAPTGTIRGVARGISIRGGLMVAVEGELREMHAGEVSLRE